MGVYQHGQDWRIEIGSAATPPVYTMIGGEGSFDDKRTSDKLDFSSKDDGAYKSTGFGQQEVMISVQGKVKLPDVGLQAVATAAKTPQTPVPIRVVSGGITKFECSMFVGNFSRSHPNNAPVTYSFDLTNNGAPTVDDIGATA